MSESLANAPVQEIKITPKPLDAKGLIETEGFFENLKLALSGGHPWRSPEALASKFGVDPTALTEWMDHNPNFCCRPGKEDGKYYYALVGGDVAREGKAEKADRSKVILEEDRYAYAILSQCHDNLGRALEKFLLRIHERSPEAFTLLATARERLTAGLALYEAATKADRTKLPK